MGTRTLIADGYVELEVVDAPLRPKRGERTSAKPRMTKMYSILVGRPGRDPWCARAFDHSRYHHRTKPMAWAYAEQMADMLGVPFVYSGPEEELAAAG